MRNDGPGAVWHPLADMAEAFLLPFFVTDFDCGRVGRVSSVPMAVRLYRIAVGYRVPFRLRVFLFFGSPHGYSLPVLRATGVIAEGPVFNDAGLPFRTDRCTLFHAA